MRFRAFVAPFHCPKGNPTLQLRRDIEYVERRLNGESLEAILEERKREAPERKTALRKAMPS